MEMDVLMSCKQMKMNSSALSMAAKLCLSSKFCRAYDAYNVFHYCACLKVLFFYKNHYCNISPRMNLWRF